MLESAGGRADGPRTTILSPSSFVYDGFIARLNGAAKGEKVRKVDCVSLSLSFNDAAAAAAQDDDGADGSAAPETTTTTNAAAPNSIVASFARFMDRWSDNPLRRFETEEWSDLIGY